MTSSLISIQFLKRSIQKQTQDCLLGNLHLSNEGAVFVVENTDLVRLESIFLKQISILNQKYWLLQCVFSQKGEL
jgi:hypothetical protein